MTSARAPPARWATQPFRATKCGRAQVHRQWCYLARRHGVSDVISPLPGQPDANGPTELSGDYDYGTAIASKHLSSWDDGRVTISGQSQQDVFFDKEATGAAGGIPCGDLVSFQVRCKHGTSGDKLQAKLTLTNTSHSGEQVTITVDGTPHSVTINGNKATLQINNEPLGQHTVTTY